MFMSVGGSNLKEEGPSFFFFSEVKDRQDVPLRIHMREGEHPK